MSTSTTLLFLIVSGQFLLSVQDLTLRLKGKKEIPDGGEVEINDLPVGGCRRYDTLECLSDVPYGGKVPNAYWVYTDPRTDEDHRVDSIRCKGSECWKFGWQSTLGIYKNDTEYNFVVRLGRRFENAEGGTFRCHFEEDSNSSVSIHMCAPPKMMLTNASVNSDNDIVAKISWDLPCGGVDKYTFYYLNGKGDCHNDTLSSNEKLHTVISASTIQIEAHRNDESVCSPVYALHGTVTELPKKLELYEGTFNCSIPSC